MNLGWEKTVNLDRTKTGAIICLLAVTQQVLAAPKEVKVIREGTASPSPSLVNVQQSIVTVQKTLSEFSRTQSDGAVVETFRYRPNTVFTVFVKQGMVTTIQIPPDEPIEQFAASDTAAVDLSVNAEANVGMLRLVNNVTVAATLVTKKHIFYLKLTPGERWHQGVSFSFDEKGEYSAFGYRNPSVSPSVSPDATGIPSLDNGLTGHPNFNYLIEGDASIRPVSVWDNGRWTWIQFPAGVQSLPAVFFMGADGAEIVNYTVQPGGKQILVNRLLSKFQLRLGSQQVMVTAQVP